MEMASIPGTVIAIDDASTRALPDLYLAFIHGGNVATRVDRDGTLIPDSPVYRVVLRPDRPLPAPPQVTRGRVLLEGDEESFAIGMWRIAVGVLVRESGF